MSQHVYCTRCSAYRPSVTSTYNSSSQSSIQTQMAICKSCRRAIQCRQCNLITCCCCATLSSPLSQTRRDSLSNNVLSQLSSSQSSLSSFQTLSYDLSTLYNNELFSDFTIQAKTQLFYVHKCILSARSTVFSAMFQSMMLEQQTSQLKIDDYDADVVDEFLKYLYTDQCSLDGLNSFGEQLLALADKYTIQQLKAQVEGHFIQYKLNKENCLKLLILSDMHQANLLKDFTIKFINTNLSIFEHGTSDWKTFRQSYPNLVADLYEKAVNLRIKR